MIPSKPLLSDLKKHTTVLIKRVNYDFFVFAHTVYSQPSGLPTVPRTLEGVVSMQGVGAIETVGLSDTQTIMIIQDDNLSSLQEATQVMVYMCVLYYKLLKHVLICEVLG